MEQKYYTPAQVAEMLSVKRSTVYQWLRDKKMPAMHMGKEYRIRPGDLLTFENECFTRKESN